MTLCGEWALLPSDNNPSDSGDSEHFFPELLENTNPRLAHNRSDVPYEELWLDHLRGQIQKPSVSEGGIRGVSNCCGTTAALSHPVSCPLVPVSIPDEALTPPPVPPKSEAVSILSHGRYSHVNTRACRTGSDFEDLSFAVQPAAAAEPNKMHIVFNEEVI